MPCTTTAIALLLLTTGLAAAQDEPQPGVIRQLGHHCLAIDPARGDNRLTGGRVWLDVDTNDYQPTGAAGHAILSVDGTWSDPLTMARGANLANRVDIVFVGDGYTASEIAQYHTDVDNFVNDMFQDEPLATYRPLFTIHRVDVISNESGVDNDPTLGISRDTALDMNFWCNNTERLLCVNVSKAYTHANTATIPDGLGPDQVIAVANSTKYGGAGYSSSDLGTASARNGLSVEVVVHELGHSMANLADEYTYGGPSVYSGNEPGTANVSVFEEADMLSQQRKWHKWLGENNPAFDGLVSTYEGGQYSQFGIYRPTNNSKMRANGRPFNLIGVESFIKQIYRAVDPIDAVSPAGTTQTGHTTLSVTPVQPVGHDLDIQWFVNGLPVTSQTSPTFDTTLVGGPGTYLVTVRVADNTPWVRDETTRLLDMTQEHTWTLEIPDCLADVNGDGSLTPTDFTAWIDAFNNTLPACDQNNDGACTPPDFTAWIANYNAGCE